MFSGKCSVRGDFLYDIAWCTFWSAWHPGIAALDVWNRVLGSALWSDDALADAERRHHCYELHIGATHLGWHAWTGDAAELRSVAARTANVLSRACSTLRVRQSDLRTLSALRLMRSNSSLVRSPALRPGARGSWR